MGRLSLRSRLFYQLQQMPQDHRDFILAREDLRNSRPRCTGESSDALAMYAVGMEGEPSPRDYPRDRGDLEACELTYRMAPAHLQERLLPVMEKFRAHVEERYPAAASI